jgi:hypothetical protein
LAARLSGRGFTGRVAEIGELVDAGALAAIGTVRVLIGGLHHSALIHPRIEPAPVPHPEVLRESEALRRTQVPRCIENEESWFTGGASFEARAPHIEQRSG